MQIEKVLSESSTNAQGDTIVTIAQAASPAIPYIVTHRLTIGLFGTIKSWTSMVEDGARPIFVDRKYHESSID